METPPINSNLLQELKISSHWVVYQKGKKINKQIGTNFVAHYSVNDV